MTSTHFGYETVDEQALRNGGGHGQERGQQQGVGEREVGVVGHVIDDHELVGDDRQHADEGDVEPIGKRFDVDPEDRPE